LAAKLGYSLTQMTLVLATSP